MKGNDKEISAEAAFQTIIKKIQSSDSKNKWNYLVKNLLIIDRLIDERCFLKEIATSNLENIVNFIEEDKKFSKYNEFINV